VLAGWFAVAGGDAGGTDLDLGVALDRGAEKSLSHGAAANISSADKEDVFHGWCGQTK
jgi:hypothetical protein